MERTLLILLLGLLASCGREREEHAQATSEPETAISEAKRTDDGPTATDASAAQPFFVGRWASDAAHCREAPWTITEAELQTPGEVTCRFHRVTQSARGVDANATCWAEGPPREWTLRFAYAESARALLIENAPFADIGLVRCDDAAAPREDSSSGNEMLAGSARAAADVLRRYFELSKAGRLEEAAQLWTASERTHALSSLQERDARRELRDVRVGEPGRIEGAAGSLYVTVPIEAHTRTDGGKDLRWTGAATLRRSNDVPGATAEQREWRIVRIDLGSADGG